MDTRTHTPVHPSGAERARTVLAAAASASVLWDGGRVDLLGCHHDDAQGDVILTLEPASVLVGAAQAAPGGDRAVRMELTELCAVSVNQRVLGRVTLAGRLSPAASAAPSNGTPEGSLVAGDRAVRLRMRVTSVTVDDRVVALADYRTAEPDPLYAGAAEHLQHLTAHHPEAIDVLSRLLTREALAGATRILPIALDRYGLVLRVERVRGHQDVRLRFARRICSGAEAAAEIHRLLRHASRRRPCGGPGHRSPG